MSPIPKDVHRWEPTGVTGYPITHPIVGQTDFYRKFRNWLPLHSEDRFAHVFAAVAPWGVGKSRLGYEIISQVNDTSQGWKVRDDDGALVDGKLFDNDAQREQHLALYIRYSQVAHRELNLDNWFAPAVYKALSPLAGEPLDASIQHRIAKQARDRLEAEGFDPSELAAAMEIGQHEVDAIYTDTALVTRLCNAAYDVLTPFGVRHVIVVLDELETAAERATGGMEAEEARAMDGKSITMLRKAVEWLGREDIEMMSKAVKEEDARARFPWLRFVALCSPAIGDELKEVQSTDRRFEIVDLMRNAFSDVSTFVKSLEAEGRLLRSYPPGLVEAAYMMSGANFGWFNVIMAVVDQVLQRVPGGDTPGLAWVFRRAIDIQSRIGRYVLDHRALDEILLSDEAWQDEVAELLFGQQPVDMASFSADSVRALLAARNVHGEALATGYHWVAWHRRDCMQALIRNRFVRLSGSSQYTAPGIPEPIDLERLLDDLATLAVRDNVTPVKDGDIRLLVPGSLPEFLQLLDLVHSHAATEETGRTLWTALMGTPECQTDEATHIGPSVEMLRRLDIRLRKASIGTVFRDPGENDAFTEARDKSRLAAQARAMQVLTGAFRLLDKNWNYDATSAGLGESLTGNVMAIRTPKTGLVDFKELWLHPKGQAVLAWVPSDEALTALSKAVAADHGKEGRYPTVAFTNDYGMPERFEKLQDNVFEKARGSVVVVHLNSGEESALRSIGLPTDQWQGFRLRQDGFTTRFAERLNRIRVPIGKQVREWRRSVSRRGNVAWPIRPNGTLKDDALKRLLDGWRVALLEQGGKSLGEMDKVQGLDTSGVLREIEKSGLSPAAAPKGYGVQDTARLWVGQDAEALPEMPPFLVRLVRRIQQSSISLDTVKSEWFWGYTWDGNRASDVFRQWMSVATELCWVVPEENGGKASYIYLSREALEGDLKAAENWLQDRYPSTIDRLRAILGPGAVDHWFRPPDENQPTGVKYQAAVQHLMEASQHLDSLGALERKFFHEDDFETARGWLIQATDLRLRVRRLVGQVFDRSGYDDSRPDLGGKALHLLDETEDRPLWERIQQAEHFVEAVRKTAQKIRGELSPIREEMRARAQDIASFPIQLFTRPLAKIDDIVDVGLLGEDPKCSTGRAQDAKPDTLAYCLKDLRVAEAMESLRKLAREVGIVDSSTENALAFDDIEGDIAKGFRDLIERYGRSRNVLGDLGGRVRSLEEALSGAPVDFMAPQNAALTDVRGRPELIAGELDQSLGDEVDDLLERHDNVMNLGRFGPLMHEAQARLLDTPERSIKGLEGKVRTLENAVTAYRESLLAEEAPRRHQEGLNALHRVLGQPGASWPRIADLEKRSLRDGRSYVERLLSGWARQGAGLLHGTDVSFEEWLDVVVRVGEQKDPALASAQMDALVNAGFLRRIYALGGAS